MKPSAAAGRECPASGQALVQVLRKVACRYRCLSEGAALKTAAPPSRASPLPQGDGQIAMPFCRSWLASELCLEVSSAAIAGKPAPTEGGGRLRCCFSVGAGLPASSALKSAAPSSRASQLPQKEGRVTVLVCRSWLASELWLEVSGAAIAGKPAPTRGGGGLRCFSVGAGLPASSA